MSKRTNSSARNGDTSASDSNTTYGARRHQLQQQKKKSKAHRAVAAARASTDDSAASGSEASQAELSSTSISRTDHRHSSLQRERSGSVSASSTASRPRSKALLSLSSGKKRGRQSISASPRRASEARANQGETNGDSGTDDTDAATETKVTPRQHVNSNALNSNNGNPVPPIPTLNGTHVVLPPVVEESHDGKEDEEENPGSGGSGDGGVVDETAELADSLGILRVREEAEEKTHSRREEEEEAEEKESGTGRSKRRRDLSSSLVAERKSATQSRVDNNGRNHRREDTRQREEEEEEEKKGEDGDDEGEARNGEDDGDNSEDGHNDSDMDVDDGDEEEGEETTDNDDEDEEEEDGVKEEREVPEDNNGERKLLRMDYSTMTPHQLSVAFDGWRAQLMRPRGFQSINQAFANFLTMFGYSGEERIGPDAAQRAGAVAMALLRLREALVKKDLMVEQLEAPADGGDYDLRDPRVERFILSTQMLGAVHDTFLMFVHLGLAASAANPAARCAIPQDLVAWHFRPFDMQNAPAGVVAFELMLQRARLRGYLRVDALAHEYLAHEYKARKKKKDLLKDKLQLKKIQRQRERQGQQHQRMSQEEAEQDRALRSKYKMLRVETNVLKMVCDMAQFIYREVTPHHQNPQLVNVMFKTLAVVNIAKLMLGNVTDWRFPVCEPDMRFIGFANGCLSYSHCSFYEYGDERLRHTVAKHFIDKVFNARKYTRDAKRCVCERRKELDEKHAAARELHRRRDGRDEDIIRMQPCDRPFFGYEWDTEDVRDSGVDGDPRIELMMRLLEDEEKKRTNNNDATTTSTTPPTALPEETAGGGPTSPSATTITTPNPIPTTPHAVAPSGPAVAPSGPELAQPVTPPAPGVAEPTSTSDADGDLKMEPGQPADHPEGARSHTSDQPSSQSSGQPTPDDADTSTAGLGLGEGKRVDNGASDNFEGGEHKRTPSGEQKSAGDAKSAENAEEAPKYVGARFPIVAGINSKEVEMYKKWSASLPPRERLSYHGGSDYRRDWIEARFTQTVPAASSATATAASSNGKTTSSGSGGGSGGAGMTRATSLGMTRAASLGVPQPASGSISSKHMIQKVDYVRRATPFPPATGVFGKLPPNPRSNGWGQYGSQVAGESDPSNKKRAKNGEEKRQSQWADFSTRKPCGCEPDYMRTPSKSYERIFRTQRMSAGQVRWAFVIGGRTLFEVKERDNWALIAFFVGVAGSGKSTVIDTILGFHAPRARGYFGERVEENFPLMTNYTKEVIGSHEMGAYSNIRSEMLAKIASGEPMDIAIKGQGSVVLDRWKAQCVFAMNNKPKFDANGGQMDRRDLTWNATIRPPRDGSDLAAPISEEKPAIAWKQCAGYYDMWSLYGGVSNIWMYLPPEFGADKVRLEKESNSIVLFLESGRLRIEPGAVMSWSEFSQEYKKYIEEAQVPDKKTLTDAEVELPFSHRGITKKKDGLFMDTRTQQMSELHAAHLCGAMMDPEFIKRRESKGNPNAATGDLPPDAPNGVATGGGTRARGGRSGRGRTSRSSTLYNRRRIYRN